MSIFLDPWISIQEFMGRGGQVLVGIAFLTFWLWTLIVERFWYMRNGHPQEVKRVLKIWDERQEKSSWYAHQIRRALISEVSARAHHSVGMIQALVALCPLLGLLGTVTGMIEVFDVMAITGSSNARAMASGVSKATIPTMAGMVVALSGLYFSVRLKQWADDEEERTADLLTHEKVVHG
jgi:biopolymer transport protein ExbB